MMIRVRVWSYRRVRVFALVAAMALLALVVPAARSAVVGSASLDRLAPGDSSASIPSPFALAEEPPSVGGPADKKGQPAEAPAADGPPLIDTDAAADEAGPVPEEPAPAKKTLEKPSHSASADAEPSQGKTNPDAHSATPEGPAGPDEPAVATKAEPVGEPLAAAIVELLQKEIVAGLKTRDVQDNFARFRNYAGQRLDATARFSGSELTGDCRLRWYDHLLRNPLSSVAEAELFTRELHTAILDDRRGLAQVLAIAADKLDLPARQPSKEVVVTSPEQALDALKQALVAAQSAYASALAPLNKRELATLVAQLYPILTAENNVGHTIQSRGTGRSLCGLMQKIDRNALHQAAESLVPITNPQLLAQLRDLQVQGNAVPAGVSGSASRIDTPGGAILIGGKGNNTYQLDKMMDVAAVVDLGGDDVYYEGTASLQRPVLILIDLDGKDTYSATKPGVQGGAMMGISMLLDLSGDDTYQAKDIAQGSCVVGAGILIDYAGNDSYLGLRRLQGQALCGVGVLIERGGDDRYHAAMWAQGFGAPLGFGLLDDVDGKDHYYAGGLYLNSYLKDENPTPGYEGWGQGVGAGMRQVCDGGVGVILDGGGDDVYEYDYLSHGGGYWCGTGFARDFGGNDQRLGATQKAYDGSARTQRSFQRFGNGYGCHYSLGFCFDDKGNDTYNGTIMCLGYAWDCSVGYLIDFGGKDSYSGSEGSTGQAGLGVLFDYDGDDTYQGYNQGYAPSSISYHSLPDCGGNFSFVVDYGGTDKYGCGAKNNSYNMRGSASGFLIDRPKASEVRETARPAPRVAADK